MDRSRPDRHRPLSAQLPRVLAEGCSRAQLRLIREPVRRLPRWPASPRSLSNWPPRPENRTLATCDPTRRPCSATGSASTRADSTKAVCVSRSTVTIRGADTPRVLTARRWYTPGCTSSASVTFSVTAVAVGLPTTACFAMGTPATTRAAGYRFEPRSTSRVVPPTCRPRTGRSEIVGGAADVQTGQAHTSRQITGRSIPPGSRTGQDRNWVHPALDGLPANSNPETPRTGTRV